MQKNIDEILDEISVTYGWKLSEKINNLIDLKITQLQYKLSKKEK